MEALNNPDDTAILRDKFFAELDKDILIYEEDGCDAIRVQEEEEQEVICNEFYSIKKNYMMKNIGGVITFENYVVEKVLLKEMIHFQKRKR